MPGVISTAPARARIEVVAAVIFNQSGEFLLAQRPPGKAYAGYWEFPGGKVEPGEDTLTALKRELHEELGINVTVAYPWLTREFDYAHAAVRLRFFRVHGWTGELHGREQQQFAWQSTRNISVSPLLPANGPILRSLELPAVYAITDAANSGRDVFMARLELSLRQGLRLIQVREKQRADADWVALASDIVVRAHAHGAKVIVNGAADIAARAGADGVHLTAAHLMSAVRRPDCDWCGASCHSAVELKRAHELGMDFVVLGPVAATASHAGAKTLGWPAFVRLTENYPLPVYALGGLNVGDLDRAWRCGAQGVGMLRGAWTGAQYR